MTRPGGRAPTLPGHSTAMTSLRGSFPLLPSRHEITWEWMKAFPLGREKSDDEGWLHPNPLWRIRPGSAYFNTVARVSTITEMAYARWPTLLKLAAGGSRKELVIELAQSTSQ